MYPNQWNQENRQSQEYGYGQQQMMQPQQMQQPQQGMQSPQQGYFSAQQYQVPGFVQQQQPTSMPGSDTSMLPIEQSFIENILRLNRGKYVTIHQTFEGNSEWNARVFRGRIEEAGRDHIIIGNPDTGEYYLLLMVNLDFVTFDEPIDYTYQYGTEPSLSQYSPR
ncbi:spore coat protein GerQ [Shouchella patagoniensis]|uniref:spore coat protein GerQ n=1 Tax=Shouchella patagoniensis TaxID=228576 RepID=UPI00099578B5|nr:spore coat protein GerQ [Shouchella patagoniensis]